MPTTVVHTIKSSGGDYSSLSAWEAAQQRNLVTADEIAVAECYGFVDTTLTTISGWTTGVNNYIIIRAHPSAKATLPPKTDGSQYVLQSGSPGTMLSIQQSYTQVDGIYVHHTTNNANNNAIFVGSGGLTGVLIRNTIMRSGNNGDVGRAFFAQGSGTPRPRLQNCVGIMIDGNGRSDQEVFQHDNSNVDYDNCLAFTIGLRNGFRPSSADPTVVRNCIAATGTGPGFSGSGFNTTFSTNNATTSATAPGVNNRTSQTFRFVDSASLNFHLSTLDTAALGFGTNLSTSATGAFSDDFDGKSRGTLWSIGPTQPNVSTQTIYNAKYGPKIINDGLILALDAGNRKSYPSTGTTWNDLTGNSNTGTLTNGPTFSSANGGSISFNGSTQYVDVANQANFNFVDTTFTIVTWLQTSATSGLFLTKGYIVGGWTVSIDSGFVGCASKNSAGFTTFTRRSNTTVNDNKWHQVVVQFTTSTTVGANNGAQIYIDGELNQAAQSNSGQVYAAETTNLQIGRRINDLFYAGNIGFVQIYNRALTAAEILQNFNATRGRFGV